MLMSGTTQIVRIVWNLFSLLPFEKPGCLTFSRSLYPFCITFITRVICKGLSLCPASWLDSLTHRFICFLGYGLYLSGLRLYSARKELEFDSDLSHLAELTAVVFTHKRIGCFFDTWTRELRYYIDGAFFASRVVSVPDNRVPICPPVTVAFYHVFITLYYCDSRPLSFFVTFLVARFIFPKWLARVCIRLSVKT